MYVNIIYLIFLFYIKTGEKPFKCPFCEKTFTEKGNSKVHIRIHTNDRPYHCPFKDICKQSFKTKSQLSDHILKHTKIKKYRCVECQACFSRKSRLKIHLMIHRGEKPFQCNICNKRFREKSNFNFHMKKHFFKLNKKLDNYENKNENKIKKNFGIDKIILTKKNNNTASDKNIEFQKPISKNNINNNENNNIENNNFVFENNDNNALMNKISESILKIKNFNNNKFNNFIYDTQIMNNKEYLNVQEENLAKDEINMFMNQNSNPNYASKNENQMNEDLIIQNIKNEKYKIENNYDHPDLTENIYMINDFNQNDLNNENNPHFGEGVENKFFNNYFQQNFPSSFNFENFFH